MTTRKKWCLWTFAFVTFVLFAFFWLISYIIRTEKQESMCNVDEDCQGGRVGDTSYCGHGRCHCMFRFPVHDGRCNPEVKTEWDALTTLYLIFGLTSLVLSFCYCLEHAPDKT